MTRQFHNAALICMTALISILVGGCGGGSDIGSAGVAGESVQRLAGDYTILLGFEEPAYTFHVAGNSTGLAGSGTAAGTAYSYAGSLSNSGNLKLTITKTGSATRFTVTGSITQNQNADAIAGGYWQDSAGLNGRATINRVSVSAVPDGPINSLVGRISLPKGFSGRFGGLALSPTSSMLYASVASQILFISLPTQSLIRSVKVSDTVERMAVSGDGSTLYVVGKGLNAIDTSSGTVNKFAVNGPLTWLTAPTAITAGSRAYFGAWDGVGYSVDIRPYNSVAQLPFLGKGVTYDAAAVNEDGTRLLVSASGKAARINTINSTLTISPFAYGNSPSSPVFVVADSAGDTLFGANAARIFAVDMITQTNIPIQNSIYTTSRISDLARNPASGGLVIASEGAGRVYVYDRIRLTLTQAIDITESRNTSPAGIPIQSIVTISRDGTRAYVTGQDAIAVIRLQ